MSEKIYTRTATPGKRGIRIDRDKYEAIREAIIRILRKKREIPSKDLADAVGTMLTQPFEGSIAWYTTTVKLDLERLGVLERIPGRAPLRLRLRREDNPEMDRKN